MNNKECRCEKCTNGCLHRPGWFRPEQLDAVAEFLGISKQELFDRYLGADYWLADEEAPEVWIIAPATVGNEGKVYPYNLHGRCVFYSEEKGCSIHSVKPDECAFAHHDESPENMKKNRADIRDSWKEHKATVTELLGQPPETPSANIFDLLEMLAGANRR